MPFTTQNLTEMRMALGRSDMTQVECLTEMELMRVMERKERETILYDTKKPLTPERIDWLRAKKQATKDAKAESRKREKGRKPGRNIDYSIKKRGKT